MTTKVRKQIYIETGQDVLLKWLAKGLGVTEAEIIRQAIDRHTRSFRFSRRDPAAWQAERAFIAQLMQQGPVPGRRTWRREDLYEDFSSGQVVEGVCFVNPFAEDFRMKDWLPVGVG